MTYFIPQTAKDKPIRGLDRPFLLSVQNAQALAASLIILLLSHGMVVWSLEFALVMSLRPESASASVQHWVEFSEGMPTEKFIWGG